MALRIAIIGGGIGGLTTALALRQFGFEPEVFEQAPELLEVGAAIAMWPNALRVLQRLGVGKEVIARAGLIKQVRWLTSDGRPINYALLPIKDVPAVALHRADLQSALLQTLPQNTVHLGTAFTTYQRSGSGIRVSFANRSAIVCDVLIGADGLHSHVRKQSLDDRPPIYRGYTVWRGVTDCSPAEVTPETAMEIQGYGKRFGIGPVGRGRVGWWASANDEDGETSQGGDEEKLLTLFSGWWAPILKLIEATPKTTILRNAVFDRPAIRKWGVGRMTLLGDAIHPTTPNLGQGGCLAVEDAAVLARCLSKYRRADRALRTYEQLRYPRTAAIANYSRRYGTIGQWEGFWSTRFRSSLLSLIPQKLTHRLLEIIFDYDAYAVRI